MLRPFDKLVVVAIVVLAAAQIYTMFLSHDVAPEPTTGAPFVPAVATGPSPVVAPTFFPQSGVVKSVGEGTLTMAYSRPLDGKSVEQAYKITRKTKIRAQGAMKPAEDFAKEMDAYQKDHMAGAGPADAAPVMYDIESAKLSDIKAGSHVMLTYQDRSMEAVDILIVPAAPIIPPSPAAQQ